VRSSRGAAWCAESIRIPKALVVGVTGCGLWAVVGVVVCLCAAWLAERSGVRINLSPSMPIGIYVSRPAPSSMDRLARGAFVAVCLPDSLARWAWVRGYIIRGRCPDGLAPVGKPIFALPGDTVTVGPYGLARNGEPAPKTSPLQWDRSGRTLPRVGYGRYPVGSGQVWLVSTYAPSSWDSRYYGAISQVRVVSMLRPVWVWSGAKQVVGAR
jgi:conjugative transfer signal peptidase TraF